MDEVWLPAFEYEGIYEVSNLGRCRRVCSNRVLSPIDDTSGYFVISLSKNGVAKNHRLHRVVLTSFCGPEPFHGAHAAHNDGDKSNCRLTNLRWATPAENQADRNRHGTMVRGSDVFGAVLSEQSVSIIRDRIRDGGRNPQIAREFGVSISTIHLIRHNRTWRHVA